MLLLNIHGVLRLIVLFNTVWIKLLTVVVVVVVVLVVVVLVVAVVVSLLCYISNRSGVLLISNIGMYSGRSRAAYVC